nr:YgjP-like metallopeptidase domain-containing protein [Sphingomicrobium nitratireducens]
MALRYDPREDLLKLTIPSRLGLAMALRWAGEHGDWIERQRKGRPEEIRLVPGATIPFDGRELLLVHEESASRRVRLEGDTIVTGGPEEAFAGRVSRWLKEQARTILSEETAAMAAAAGVRIAGVSVGDARSRWGSCSSAGRLRYSWRLVMMPPQVRRYIVAHEVAHRVHMDHGRAFHALEAKLFGGSVREAKGLLRVWGKRLQRVG